MSFDLKSNRLLENLQQMGSRFAGKQQIGAKLCVGEDSKWWYYHEFGTATHEGDAVDAVIPPSVTVQEPEGGTGSSYDILPKNGEGIRLPVTNFHREAVVFPAIGQGYTAEHPGVPALGLVRTVLEDIHTTAAIDIMDALHEGDYEPQSVQEAIATHTMNDALERITESISEKMGHSLVQRADPLSPGRLDGVSPADVFNASATITTLEE